MKAQQSSTATIQGTVTDATGAVIPNANVTITNVDTGVAVHTVSNAQGRYSMPTLAIGNYQVQVSSSGFQEVTHGGIVLSVGSQVTVDFALPVGQTQQTVTVEGQVSQVETTSTTISSLVDQTQMRQLPLNGRDVEQLILLAPGVQSYNTGSGQGSSNGGAFYGNDAAYSFSGNRGTDEALLLDGQDIQNFWGHGTGTASTGNSLGIEAIAEFQTLTSTYSAQYGGDGAVMTAVTKSGTNAFHGSGYEFLRNSTLDAANYFQTSGIPPFRRNQFGGSVGGPIKKDKAFFFFNYEGIRQLLSETEVVNTPDANARNGYLPCATAGSKYTCTNGLAYVGVSPNVAPTLTLYPLPAGAVEKTGGVAQYVGNGNQITSENYYLGRVDYNFSSQDSIFARYVFDGARVVNPFPGSPLPLWPETDTTPNQFFTVEERHIFSPNLINSVRFSITRTDNGNAPITLNSGGPLDVFPGQNRPDSDVTITGLSGLGPDSENFRDIQNKIQEGDDLIWNRGAHTLNIGIDIERIDTNNYQCYRSGDSWTFSSLQNFLLDSATIVAGDLPGPQNCTRDLRETDLSPYFQDQWKVNQKLTVNAGLRYEFMTNPIEEGNELHELINPPYSPAGCVTTSPASCFYNPQHIFVNGNPSVMNFDPRIGLAYDPFADHKTSFRAGFGLFHDVIETWSYFPGISSAPPQNIAQQSFPVFPFPFSAVSPAPITLNPGFDFTTNRTPYDVQWSLSVQRDLGFSTLLSLTYVGSRGIDLLDAIDQNPVIPTTVNGVQTFGSLVSGKLVSNPRINPNFGLDSDAQTAGWSLYNGLQVALNHRFTNNFTEQLSYTYSHCEDNGSGSFGDPNNGGNQDPYNNHLDKGNCGFDIRHALRLNGLYVLPLKGNELVQGWQLGGILTASTGLSISPADGFDYVGDQNVSRPNRVSCSQLVLGSPTQWFNPACFALQAPGTLGDAGRTNIPGPGLVDLDFSIVKDTKITKISEGFDLQFRAEFFNLFNHPNFGLPNASIFAQNASGGGTVSPSAGQITNTVDTSRQIQFGLKAIF